MNELEKFAMSTLEMYQNRIDLKRVKTREEKICLLQEFYEEFYPNELVNKFNSFGSSFKDYYEKTAKSNPIKKSNEIFVANNTAWLIKPEAYFLREQIKDYLCENIGEVVNEGKVQFNKEDLIELYGTEMSYPIYSNIVSEVENTDFDVIYSFILRIASFLSSPSYMLITNLSNSEDLSDKIRKNKKIIRDRIIFPALINMGINLVDERQSLKGLDPVEWFELDPTWVPASYNGIHSPSDSNELNRNIKLFQRLKR